MHDTRQALIRATTTSTRPLAAIIRQRGTLTPALAAAFLDLERNPGRGKPSVIMRAPGARIPDPRKAP